MSDEWMTYAEAAALLGLTAESVRQRAIRGRWQRSRANDGLARIRLPEGYEPRANAPDAESAERPDKRSDRTPDEPRANADHERLIAAFESHLESLRSEVAHLRESESAAHRTIAEERAKAAEALAEHIRIREQLAEAKAMLAATTEKHETRRQAWPWIFRRSA